MIVIDTGPVVAAANRKDDFTCSASTCSRISPARSCCPPHC
ncbi:hypothetical protein [Streptomyces purpureus]|nr:hypothetical protein [Streptomyces purpureus]